MTGTADMDLMAGRVRLTPRPADAAGSVLPACFIGHCPGRVRPERLRPRARAALRDIGFGAAVDHLDAAHPPGPAAAPPAAPGAASTGELDAATRARLSALKHLPLPLRAAAELTDLFPDAATATAGHPSTLGGSGAWLPQAVADFFANGGELLWVIVVPEAEGRGGFFGLPEAALADPDAAHPSAPLPLHMPLALRGLGLALAIPDIGILALPDLERLQVPPTLAGPPRVRLPNPAPRFLPCSVRHDDGHRERRHGPEMVSPTPPLPTLTLLGAVAGALADYRPDLMCLYTLPLAAAGTHRDPVPQPAALAQLAARAGSGWSRGRRLQLLWPYLRDADLGLRSAVGVVAGAQAQVAARLGPWRSAAGMALVSAGNPYPPVAREQAAALRTSPGVGVLHQRGGSLELEDERLLVPALHPTDAVGRTAPGWRSGEVQRFLGWLQRRLRRLGEALVFDADPDDPRVPLLLERFCRSLHDRGALRGAQPRDAFSIRPLRPVGGAPPGVLGYELELAPAFPLDRVRLTFVNQAGSWGPASGGPASGGPASGGPASGGPASGGRGAVGADGRPAAAA
ncbi:hypothetical protein [uncultured Thiohalocapsa sp.]|uniref:hypothetical protein n=1 Tax=uncultured Thiohalocapsa sp. TaxID=768990 RepID=UPI0025EFF456|nr:hypothetical protein [uncultured Thiohalocapsa sp.]